MSAILLDDAIIHYEVLGRGRPVIFLHSWIGSWRYWMPTMQFVSSTYRSYALDLWGFGDSAKLDTRYSFEWQIALLDGFVQHMGIGNFSLVGHGLGAILALYYAADRSAVIDQLMVLGYPMGSQAINQRLLSGSPVQMADWLFGKSNETKAYREDSSRTDARAIAASFAQFGQANWRQLALRTQRPSLWVYGQNDSLVNFPGDKETSFLPDTGHLLLFEQSGHYPMLDEPLKFNRLLIDFLSIGPDQDLSELQIKEEWRRRVR
jgi:pimeloyl-ACP methyl ester carboxylesterase